MKKNILIVDDFQNSLFVTGFTIQTAGYNVLKAESGQKAIELLRTNSEIDLIITDYNMPEMNGLELVKQAKSIMKGKNLPIFVLSTETKEEIRKAALSEGVTLWIRKPFKTDQLVECIKKAIG
jgi:two-component system, chemotaxis family, chemotaxis protein CheY